MSDPDEGEVCEAFVPYELQESDIISQVVGPPVYELSEEENE